MRKIKTGVSYLNVNYNWNEEKRVVACHLKFGINLDKVPFIDMLNGNEQFNEFLNSYFNIEEWQNNTTGEYINFAVTEVTGFAYCHEDDTFDLEIGKKIAETRAQEAAFEDAEYFWLKCEDIMLNVANRFSVLAEHCVESADNCHNHINDFNK